jgi:TldD protein
LEDLAESTIDHARKLGAEFADLRLEHEIGTNIVVMDGKTKTMSSHAESGCGIRALTKGAWGFAVTNTLTRASLRSAAEAAVRMAKAAELKAKVRFDLLPSKAVRAREEYRCKEKPSDVRLEEKLGLVLSLDRTMRTKDARISSANSRYDDLEVSRIIANSFGTLALIEERWTLAACSAWAKSDGVVQRGHASVGNVGGYELMRKRDSVSIGDRAAAQALRLLDSKPAPAGKFTCILDQKMTGLMAHEAFGHACEADAVLSGASVLEDRVGKKVADESISLYDDPTIRSTFGYFSLDWEGVKASRHALIEKGILRGFMHNLETGSRMGTVSNGSARSQAYNSPPIIRMSNTFIGPGTWKKDELFEQVRDGLLLQGSQYGYVEPAKGQFMFKCDEAYEVRNGEIGQRYRDVSLSGVILEVLNNVKAIADDFVLTDPGYCGKGGQNARTTDGGPHICITDVVVGGLS